VSVNDFYASNKFYLKAGDHDLHDMVTKCHECIFLVTCAPPSKQNTAVCVCTQTGRHEWREIASTRRALTHSLVALINYINNHDRLRKCNNKAVAPMRELHNIMH
jgi:hypothetical protein